MSLDSSSIEGDFQAISVECFSVDNLSLALMLQNRVPVFIFFPNVSILAFHGMLAFTEKYDPEKKFILTCHIMENLNQALSYPGWPILVTCWHVMFHPCGFQLYPICGWNVETSTVLNSDTVPACSPTY